MKCADLLRILSGYVGREIDPGLCKEFEKHLAGCNPCKIVVDNVRKTITLYRDESVYDLPEPFRAKLHRLLREKGRRRRRKGRNL